MFLGDAGAIIVSVIVAIAVSGLLGRNPERMALVVSASVIIPVWFLSATVIGQYKRFTSHLDYGMADDLGPVLVLATACGWLVVVVQSVVVAGVTEILTPALIWLGMIVAVPITRSWTRRRVRRNGWLEQDVAIVGDPADFVALGNRIARHPEWGMNESVRARGASGGTFVLERPHGLDDNSDFLSGDREALSVETFAMVLAERRIERVLIASDFQDIETRGKLVQNLARSGIVVDLVSAGPEALYPGALVQHYEGVTVLTLEASKRSRSEVVAKRLTDVAVAGIGLLVVSPILLAAAIAIKLDSRGSVFFRQDRGGKGGVSFNVLKLRTMVDDADSHRDSLRDAAIHGRHGGMLKVANDPRVTRVGTHLRNWSIDELPQLWNVLRGDMSLVGPRPLPLDEILEGDSRFIVRQSVRPGLTGPWQVMGRSGIPMGEMLKLDNSYAVGWSLAGDWKIAIRTIPAVLGRKGVY